MAHHKVPLSAHVDRAFLYKVYGVANDWNTSMSTELTPTQRSLVQDYILQRQIQRQYTQCSSRLTQELFETGLVDHLKNTLRVQISPGDIRHILEFVLREPNPAADDRQPAETPTSQTDPERALQDFLKGEATLVDKFLREAPESRQQLLDDIQLGFSQYLRQMNIPGHIKDFRGVSLKN
ncbi:hypothetical protein VKT23_014051 [Stygiomarasmius scandens]|uniref:Uncharacterized protein n=1 Tax=Marasmiellus scandens TaxID=2682957 RepID=A0ABR1J4N7_9AGAR